MEFVDAEDHGVAEIGFTCPAGCSGGGEAPVLPAGALGADAADAAVAGTTL